MSEDVKPYDWDYLFSRVRTWYLTEKDKLYIELDSEVGQRWEIERIRLFMYDAIVETSPIATRDENKFKWYETLKGTVKEGDPKKMFIDYLRNKSQRY